MTSGPEFDARVSRQGAEARLAFSGEFDAAALERARDALDRLLDASLRSLVVDLGGLRFMDSAGIWLLVEAQDRCLRGRVELRVTDAQPPVARALRTAGLLHEGGDGNGNGHGGPVHLRLYVSERPRTREAAISAARAVVARLGETARLEVIDVVDAPGRAELDRIIATPTLIKIEPSPESRLIGQLPEPAAVLHQLGLDGAS
jgi:circadian clock protein KaiB